MKILLLPIAIIFMSFTITTDPVERLGIKAPLKFNKTDFSLAWSEKPNATYYVQEYVPKGETVERFDQMLTVNLFNVDVSVDDAVAQKIQELTDRKKTDAVCNFSVIESPDKKEKILDCILSAGSGEKMEVVEFIIYKYIQIELKDKSKALIIYSYSKRAYGDDITPFLKKLKDSRSGLLNEMITSKVPETKL